MLAPEPDFNNTDTFARATMLLVAVEAGELTESQAAKLAGVDVVTLREMRLACLDACRAMWGKWRRETPAASPEVGAISVAERIIKRLEGFARDMEEGRTP